MNRAPVSKEDIQAFFYRMFGDSLGRKRTLCRWHSIQEKSKHVRLADIFEEFMQTILSGALRLHLYWDRIYIFEGSLPIRFDWMNETDSDLMIRMYAQKETLFGIRKEYESNQCDYTSFIFNEYELFDRNWRQLLIRDFIWMISATQQPFIIGAGIVALQKLQLSNRSNLFISRLHAGLQGHCNLREVLCQDTDGNQT